MTSNPIGNERRVDAPHPGPLIKREYVDTLGIAVPDLAAHAGIEAARLEAMLVGACSLDVDAAIRLSRSLQLSAERIMRMQVRRDFADARGRHDGESIEVFGAPAHEPFPETFVRGHLAHATAAADDGSFFFQQTLPSPVNGDAYAGLHALWRGDRLRIFDPTGIRPVWIGPILSDLDGHVMLPYVRTETWLAWFDQRRPAELAFGEEHAAFFERMARG